MDKEGKGRAPGPRWATDASGEFRDNASM